MERKIESSRIRKYKLTFFCTNSTKMKTDSVPLPRCQHADRLNHSRLCEPESEAVESVFFQTLFCHTYVQPRAPWRGHSPHSEVQKNKSKHARTSSHLRILAGDRLDVVVEGHCLHIGQEAVVQLNSLEIERPHVHLRRFGEEEFRV